MGEACQKSTRFTHPNLRAQSAVIYALCPHFHSLEQSPRASKVGSALGNSSCRSCAVQELVEGRWVGQRWQKKGSLRMPFTFSNPWSWQRSWKTYRHGGTPSFFYRAANSPYGRTAIHKASSTLSKNNPNVGELGPSLQEGIYAGHNSLLFLVIVVHISWIIYSQLASYFWLCSRSLSLYWSTSLILLKEFIL